MKVCRYMDIDFGYLNQKNSHLGCLVPTVSIYLWITPSNGTPNSGE